MKALERDAVRPIEAELTIPEGSGVTVVGDRKVELGQLGGRALRRSMLGAFGSATESTSDRAKVEWVVSGPAGATLPVTVRHQRAGVVRTDITLA
jgi:hypothetical protein